MQYLNMDIEASNANLIHVDETVEGPDEKSVGETREALDVGLVRTSKKRRIGKFQVRVLSSPAGEMRPEEAVSVEYDDIELQDTIQQLDVRALGRAGLVAFGRTLAGWLLPPKQVGATTGVWELYHASLMRVGEDTGLRLRLHLPPQLAALPWEYMYVNAIGGNEMDGFLALNRRVALVRYEALDAPALPPAPTGPVKVVVAMAAPSGLAPLALAKEKANLQQALKEQSDLIQVEYLEDATLNNVYSAIAAGTQVFHFAGHGMFTEQMETTLGTYTGTGSLALDDMFVAAEQLGTILYNSGVRLAVLSACETGRHDAVNAWSGIAPVLVRVGVPAVVANQFSILDHCAIAFYQQFYKAALVGGLSIEEAVSAGRIAAYQAELNGREWGVPTLYLRAADGHLFGGATTAWTWMMYLVTHNNVELAGEQSMAYMRQSQGKDRVRVLVQQATLTGCVRRVIGAIPEVVSNLGQVDLGEPTTLIDFIRWAAVTAPAQRYALVLWNDRSGWQPSEMARLAQQQPIPVPVTTAELTQRGVDDGQQVFFSSTMRTLLAQPTPPERAMAFDDGSGHSLDTVELGQVMAEATKILGQQIDLLGMNACLMSTAEVAYQVHNHARVYVASEELMPTQSWPYDDILTRLKSQPDMDAATLGKMIVERYCAYFRAPSSQTKPGVTLTALQLAGVESLATAVRAFARALQADIDHQLDAIWAAHRATHSFLFRLYDLVGFCRAFVTQSTAAPDSIAAAQDVLTVLADPAFLLATNHTSQTYDDTGGVSTYLMPPTPGKMLSPSYAKMAYAQATGWGDFLAAYHAAISGPLTFVHFYEERVNINTPKGLQDQLFIDKLAAEMLSQRRGAFPVTDLVQMTELGQTILSTDPDSSYNRLLDNGILTVVSDAPSLGDMVKFTYDQLGGYILARYLLRTTDANASQRTIQGLIHDVQQFPLGRYTAQTMLVLSKDAELFANLAQSSNIELQELVVESLVEMYADEQATALDIIQQLVQKDSQEIQRTGLRAAYSVNPRTREVFLWAIIQGTPALRQSTGDFLYLIWQTDPSFTYDLLRELTTRIKPNTLQELLHDDVQTLKSLEYIKSKEDAASDYAVVIGIARYPSLGNLQGPENDARRFYEWLVAPDGGAVPKAQVALILSSHYPAPASRRDARPTIEDVNSAFEHLIEQGRQNGRTGRRLYIYMAGRGFAPNMEESALLMANASLETMGYHIPGRAYAQWFVTSAFFDEVVLLMDCDRVGDSRARMYTPPWSPIQATGGSKVHYFYAFATEWSATARERPSSDSGEVQGVFTQLLLTGLYGAASNEQGRITGASLMAFVLNHLRRRLKEDEYREPVFEFDDGNEIVFAVELANDETLKLPPEAHLDVEEAKVTIEESAASIPSMTNAYALIIGINNYQSSPATKLRYAVDDALAIVDVLVEPQYCGYARDKVQLLLDEQATRLAVLRALADLAARTNQASTVLIYFSGHGTWYESSEAYMIPVDGKDTQKTYISSTEFTAALDAIPARNTLVVIDSVAFGSALQERRGRAILAAARRNELVSEHFGQGHGGLTYHLLSGLRGAVASEDGFIRIFDLFEYVQPQVTVLPMSQHPILKVEPGDNFPIALYQGGRQGVVSRDVDGFRYDVYVSYAQSDADWVWKTLVPPLKEAGLRIAISNDVEQVGVSRVVNAERGITQSRRTLIVLSENYLADYAEAFEGILNQTIGVKESGNRLLSVLIAPLNVVSLPQWLRGTLLDVTNQGLNTPLLERLVQMLRKSRLSGLDYESYITERARDFTGRDWVFQAINDWLADTDGPRFFLLTGEPGSGKTAIASRLSQFAQGVVPPPHHLIHLTRDFLSAIHFCSARDSRWIDPLVFVQSLAMPLVERYPVYAKALTEKSGDRQIRIEVNQQVQNVAEGQIVGVVINRLDVSGVAPEDAFNRVIREPLEALFRDGFDRQVIILVDALDEALSYSGRINIVSLLSRTNSLPRGVRFLVTTRPAVEVLRRFQSLQLEEVNLTSKEGLNRSLVDVREYVNYRLQAFTGRQSSELTDQIAEAAEGNFLYARFVLDDLLSNRVQVGNHIGLSLPKSLSDIYRQFIEQNSGRNFELWQERYRPLLGVLAVACGDGLTRAQLAGIVGITPSQTNKLLQDCAQYLISSEPDGPLRIYHSSFRDFLLGDEEYHIDLAEANQAIVNYFLNAYAGSWLNCKDDYALRYTPTHIVEAAQYTDQANTRQKLMDTLANLLNNQDFTRAKSERIGVDALLTDLQTALHLFPSESEQAHQLLVTLQRLGIALAQAGEWERALAVIEKIEDSDARARALGELGTVLAQAGQWERAEAMIHTIEIDYWRAVALSKLGVMLAQAQQWERAETVIQTIEDSDARARALAELGTALAQAGQWERAEAVIHTIEQSNERLEALRVLRTVLDLAGYRERAEAVQMEVEAGKRELGATTSSPISRDEVLARIEFVRGDLLDLHVDALVNPTGVRLENTGYVGEQLIQRIGYELQEKLQDQPPLESGEVFVTDAGSLPVHYLIHTRTESSTGWHTVESVVAGATAALTQAERLGDVQTIAFPALGTGAAGMNSVELASEILMAITRHLEQGSHLEKVIFVFISESHYQAYVRAYRALGGVFEEVRQIFNNYSLKLSINRDQIMVGERMHLQVLLQPASVLSRDNVVEVPTNVAEVHCSVSAEGMRVHGPDLAAIPIDPRASELAPANFELEAHLRGLRSFTVELFIEDPQSGRLRISQTIGHVTVESPTPGEERPPLLPALEVRVAPLPDFVLEVDADPTDTNLSSHHLTYRLTSRLPFLQLEHQKVGEVVLRKTDLACIKTMIRQTVQQATNIQPEDSYEHMLSMGTYLFDRLFPADRAKDFRDTYWKVADRLTTWLIVEDGIVKDGVTWLPWELVVPYRAGDVASPRFLGERYHLSRWIEGLGSSLDLYNEVPIGEVALAHYKIVERGQEDQDEELLGWRRLLKADPAYGIVQAVKPETAIFGLHLLRHADQTTTQDIAPRDGPAIARSPEEEMPQVRLDLWFKRPVVTLGILTQADDLTNADVDDWPLPERARTFLRVGASAVVGPWWPTSEDADQVFWPTFYDLLARRMPLGEAVWRARLAVWRMLPHRPDWLAYALFGDPRARPYWPQPSEGYTALECINPDEPLLPNKTYYFRVSIRSRPPAWHKDRLVFAENLPQEPRAIFLAPGLQLATSEPIEMVPFGRTMVQATVGMKAREAGVFLLTVRLLDGEEGLQSLRLKLAVGEAGTVAEELN